ncbi:1-(5-phosphoribosyl)-5-[(5-phosphoribosylamino)methylideneamino]imidazole-4-carboxamide isomerase [Leptospirillum ferriphilum]|jgi:phosphoribosylformimino-5-aminoimidazole carboxamide ribotide isomerase|uniref:1-(5-phosphoribosyl)-5-[(5-phosphoribosylamino)methylideneamino] imidazole-4-carboxamide isomerase n=2 Tax=Leptospirillum TaxID=179 RepID=A0A094WAI3_9BACT|nr:MULTISPECIES: 1-(5-phosphoribosyl)-5-[(5-phosphoribosylamino)methylideneamino]imidazole-4-carboxamide isomerase [Leptospirillum]EDZ40149.1 MAG: 1-(5-phosphoribosyl)-5-((5- phosphoribosylamino)methylideneamino) imidazole-4- carboxamide isomerase [Leptospirillum sp. Group II '5-way CG']EIJ76134.1 MAG: 1-(5-phosphoribosyl)-5-((5-phosphoribosylamino)methylideneamino) imidazole-4-carboxamide isomerase [Leptospirillum sp. Group II 'C75']MCL5259495.1 1-(5-phosphoribosyl)-5-[(5-phosphoribosylamino)me
MQLYPAIDIRNGKVVRLTQGRFDQETIYGEDPVRTALHFRERGVQHLHVVDLDGAREGVPVNRSLIREIVKAFNGFVQVGGGVRSKDIASFYYDAGVSRLILGTAAIKDPVFLGSMIEQHPDLFYVGIDVKDESLAVNGWLDLDTQDPLEVMVRMSELGVRGFVYTDIHRDGLLSGPNFARYEILRRTVRVPVIASGGVRDISDIARLREIGVDGAIVGKAIYTGEMDLTEALRLLGIATGGPRSAP